MQQRRGTLPTEYDALTIARQIAEIAVDKKASDVALLDIHNLTTIAEYFVLANGSSDRMIRAVANGIEDAMDEEGVRLLHSEGVPADGWVLLDYGQIVVHLFAPEQREYYDLERHWKEAPTLLKIQ